MASWWCSSLSATVSVTTTTATTTRRYPLISHTSHFLTNPFPPSPPSSLRFRLPCSNKSTVKASKPPPSGTDVDCVGTGQNAECTVNLEQQDGSAKQEDESSPATMLCLAEGLWELAVLVSPFFFWGTAMVAMKEVLPKCGPFFVSAFRLIPAGFLLVGFAASRGRPLPSGFNAWLSISLFALVDATCFQVSLLSLTACISVW